MSNPVLYETDQHIAHIILNKPDIRNAFDDQLISQLTDLLHSIDQDPQIRVVILRANGKHFSAGADLNWMQRMKDYSEQDNVQDSQKLASLMQRLYTLSKPTIALINGAAYGGALGLIACCDLAIACQDSQFCFSEVKIGIIPAVISPYIVKAVGFRESKKLFLTAEIFNAQYALNIGLISQIVATEDLQLCGLNHANQILDNSPQAITACKQLLFGIDNKTIDQSLMDFTAQQIAKIRVSEQGQEGLQAFLEKRKPNWMED